MRPRIDFGELAPPRQERLDIVEAGVRYIDRLEGLGRKKTTISDHRSMLRVHLIPFFGGRSLDGISVELVESFITAKQREGKAPKSISNYLGLLYSIFVYAEKRGWTRSNPVARAEKPRVEPRDADIRYLELDELEDLIRAVPADELGSVEGVLYRTAAMTGLRRGELLALRWRGVDRTAGVIGVRRSYTRSEFGTPKSRRSSRAVPSGRTCDGARTAFPAIAVHSRRRSRHRAPLLGTMLDPSKVQKRFKGAGGTKRAATSSLS